jgi:heme exporter protein B
MTATMWTTARAVARKDIAQEVRSKVVLVQILPFVLVVLLLFGFALDPDAGLLRAATPGLFWVTLLLVLLLAVQRTYAAETADGAFEAMRLAGLPPAGVFLGKFLALLVELLAVELVMVVGVLVLYDPTSRSAVDLVNGVPAFHWTFGRLGLLLVTLAAATPGLAAMGTLQGALSAGTRARDTLLPLLVLPVVTPALIGATRAMQAALGLQGRTPSEGWPWIGLLVVFALAVVAAGVVAFGPLMEADS